LVADAGASLMDLAARLRLATREAGAGSSKGLRDLHAVAARLRLATRETGLSASELLGALHSGSPYLPIELVIWSSGTSVAAMMNMTSPTIRRISMGSSRAVRRVTEVSTWSS